MRDGRVNIEDNLVDSNNRPILASVNFEVRYSSPENVEGNFDSPTVSKYVHQQSLDDDQQMLLNIEQNIANLEKSLNKGICHSSCPRKAHPSKPSSNSNFFPQIRRTKVPKYFETSSKSSYLTRICVAQTISLLIKQQPWISTFCRRHKKAPTNNRNLIIFRCRAKKAEHIPEGFGRR